MKKSGGSCPGALTRRGTCAAHVERNVQAVDHLAVELPIAWTALDDLARGLVGKTSAPAA